MPSAATSTWPGKARTHLFPDGNCAMAPDDGSSYNCWRKIEADLGM